MLIWVGLDLALSGETLELGRRKMIPERLHHGLAAAEGVHQLHDIRTEWVVDRRWLAAPRHLFLKALEE